MEDLRELLAAARNNNDFLRILYMIRWRDGFCCPQCGGNKGYQCKRRYRMQCMTCGLQTSPTSRTALHGVRNLSAWFRTIRTFTDSGQMNAIQLSGLLEIRYATAWLLLQKTRMVLACWMEKCSEGFSIVPAEQMKKALFKSDRESRKYKDLSETSSDFTRKDSKVILPVAARFVFYLLWIYRGISRKYAREYAAEFSMNAKSKQLDMLELLEIFVRASPVNKNDILARAAPDVILLGGAF